MYKWICMFFLMCSSAVQAQQLLYHKQFFVNSPMKQNYFYSSISYRHPSWIRNMNHKLPVTSEKFFTPGNAILLHYKSSKGGAWQADIQYQEIRGIDHFSDADNLVFQILIPSGMPMETLPLIAIAEEENTHTSFIPIQDYIPEFVMNKWLTISIPLTDFKPQMSEENIQIIQFKQQSADNKEHILYIDQIELLPDMPSAIQAPAAPDLIKAKGYEKHVDITWQPIKDSSIKYIKVYRSEDGENFYPVGIQSPWISRYADYTGTTGKKYYYKISLLNQGYEESELSNKVSSATHPMSDSDLLDMVQEAHFSYYWEGAEKNSGMALENIPGRRHMVATGASGFGIMALIAGTERQFISRQQAVERLDRITSFLMKAEKFHGAFPHFIDGRSGKVVPFFGEQDNGGDLVETAFLMQGLLCARQYFDAGTEQETHIRKRIDSIWNGIEWDWYRKTPDSEFLYWHWSPDKGWIINHRLIGWNETMIVYILGISSPTHGIPASMYYSGWASQSDYAQNYRSNWSHTKEGAHYVNGNTYYGVPLKVGVSTGGPLFFTHYSFMGLDPREVTDAYTNYFINNKQIALINYRYCSENPEDHQGYGAAAWGLTASDGPRNYSADEPAPHADHGKITPTGALASFPYLPEKAMDALKNYYRNYGEFLWGTYGLYDSFIPEKNWRSKIFMGLNQAPVTVMIENYRTGLLWNLFMTCPEIQQGLKKLSMEQPTRNNANQ